MFRLSRGLSTLLTVALLASASPALALDILVTNDDGIASPGVQVLASVLAAAGHDVTVVAPQDQQSGKGGSINTGAFTTDFVPIVRIAPNQWAVAGTPADTVNAALNVILKDNPPDLVVSGLNEGQNLSKLTSNTSGTIGAALYAALDAGIPAIAGSVGVLFQESQLDPRFPSTQAAYPAAAALIVDVIAELEENAIFGQLLPPGVRLLNVNFPVPAADWQGTRITRLGDVSDFRLPWFDVTDGFPPFFPALPVATPCDQVAVGGFCLASIGVVLDDGPDTAPNADTDAHRDGYVSITPMSGDMTSGALGRFVAAYVLRDLLD